MSMSETDAGGTGVAWVIPPHVDPEASAEDRPSGAADVRDLVEEMEAACQPEEVSVEVVPGGVSTVTLRFPDRAAAFEAFDAAAARIRSHRGVACRVAASSRGPIA